MPQILKTPSPAFGLADRVHHRLFDALYSRSLVYNTCWEDPAVDRVALRLRPEDTLLVITSAGCNVLDYALEGPSRIYAVDANPRQTALLELKLAGIRRLDHADFFDLFGRGRHDAPAELYRDALRDELSPFARKYWDRHIGWFGRGGRRNGFYYRSLSGRVARAIMAYVDLRPTLRDAAEALFEAEGLDRQRELYDTRVAPLLWTAALEWALRRQFTLSLLGVPGPQHEEVKRQHPGGVAGFVRDAVDYVFRWLPARTNYFWSVYLRGGYTLDCCPEYLRPGNFAALKAGLVDRIEPHTATVTEFLEREPGPISRFVLLDHMDWMSSFFPRALIEEWVAILRRASHDARIIFRSAHASPSYLARLEVPTEAGPRRLDSLLSFDSALAAELQRLDRVHTYAGFHIADVAA
jgi:S-adenosylmethionine-diacylglycerol 3-amino-3-carboxypropyl transferase